MLTDEELKELEEAVDATESVLGRTCSVVTLDWFMKSLQWLLTLWRFCRDAIAREKAMRQPLTAEICERLGMYMIHGAKEFIFCRFSPIEEGGLDATPCYFREDGSGVVYGCKGTPTVGHLFAAAKLAGVELDWRKVGE